MRTALGRENLYKDTEECKGTVHLGKGLRNKYSMVTRSDVSEKTKGKNGKLYRDKMV